MLFTPVAEARGIYIYASKEGRISFFNSPYPAHRKLTAVDVYPSRSIACSPVSGEIVFIQKFNPPRKEMFGASSSDYIICIRVSEELVARLLHVKPEVEIGEKVKVGEKLGVLLRSGFFDFWTDPHVHVEIRKNGDFLRPLGALPLRPLIGDMKNRGVVLEGEVVCCRPEYCLSLIHI
mgnify:CR=1 FL=1